MGKSSCAHHAPRLLPLIVLTVALSTSASASAQLCPSTPMPACAYSTNFSRLRLQTGVFLWKWRRGTLLPADIGDPVNATDFSICIYTDGSLLQEMSIPHGGQCRKHACWKKLDDRGFAYKDPEGLHSGVNWVKFKFSGLKAIMKMKGRGPNVSFPLPLSVTNDVTMQMVNSNGKCWEGVFPTPAVKDTADAYVDTLGFLTAGR